MKFSHTEHAAKIDEASNRETKWMLIEAIAQDAEDNGVPIVGVESRLAAKAALDAAGNEHADRTITDLCMVAKFDRESTRSQREVWRRYGWTSVRVVAKSGVGHDAAFRILGGAKKLTFREIEKAVHRASNGRATITATPALDEALRRWVNRLDGLLTEGATLAERAETEGTELSGHSALALLIYERITESKIDTELRDLIEAETAR